MTSWLPFDANGALGPEPLQALSDGIIALSFLAIAAALLYLYRKRDGHRPGLTALVVLFTLFMVALGLAHLVSLLAIWVPGLSGAEPRGLLTALGAILALAAAVTLWTFAPRLLRLPSRDRLQAEVAANEDRLRLLLRELTHRCKNLLTVVHAIARQTAARANSVDEFLDRFGARLMALGSSHDLLIADDWQGASLRMLVERQLGEHTERFGDGIDIEGEDVILKPEAVQNLALALHELAANAQRYGSLSKPDGQVSVCWNVCEKDSKLKLVWQEQGGPPVVPPERSGFGRTVIESVMGRALEGDVMLSFQPKGVRCEIDIPLGQIVSRG
jgi:two-component sensor histidine kinase